MVVRLRHDIPHAQQAPQHAPLALRKDGRLLDGEPQWEPQAKRHASEVGRMPAERKSPQVPTRRAAADARGSHRVAGAEAGQRHRAEVGVNKDGPVASHQRRPASADGRRRSVGNHHKECAWLV